MVQCGTKSGAILVTFLFYSILIENVYFDGESAKFTAIKLRPWTWKLIRTDIFGNS